MEPMQENLWSYLDHWAEIPMNGICPVLFVILLLSPPFVDYVYSNLLFAHAYCYCFNSFRQNF